MNTRFSDYNMEYSNFFYLAGRKLLLWGGFLALYPFIWYLKRNYADKHKFCKLWETLELKYRYTFVLRAILLTYPSFMMASALNFFKMNFVNLQTTISCFVAIALQICMIYFPIMIMNVLQKNYDKLDNKKFLDQFSTII